ncbi:class I SAM-dependent methyltransferase [Entomomonas asaccharolytica]|uniref:Ribosomal RNA small subunit methyltransferase J n=1 Tax=Entomomonas asaccharolytica TaxID=2785331 RepID=A0A974NGH6_9GAMM|nr:class I SAM-dependent methyltransferase [Entomomonas asaccharolytica]QQP86355.1 class I SAM-dependent methyltransferase [Entomomonas asaccharolytica]
MVTDLKQTVIRVEAMSADWQQQAIALASELSLAAEGEADFALQLGEYGLQLQCLTEKNISALKVDFVEGAVAHRRKFGGGKGQMIAKAVGIQGNITPSVLDATAGLGKDAFVLASLGCEITLIERQPIIAALLEDGLRRALQDSEICSIAQQMTLIKGNAIDLMKNWQRPIPQVVYVDPMFPHRDKSALVKKEMRLFRPLVGDDLDAAQLLATALALASHRVVVKRPRKAPIIEGISPSYQLQGKSSRYDIYTKRSLKVDS